ncbi:protein translocase subunit SecA isoform X2 [Triplophysa rosa]|uniref:protein translocase subunit SecA isoform X2 n=1 Tax=Triplophysa rosa TaxID=992332 RepID=UPI00254609E0|nr:protein translocase subunit SecA isoform X2 [Triplophysa rosa]
MEAPGETLSSRLISLFKNGQWGEDDVVKLFKALVEHFNIRNDIHDFYTWVMKILHQVEIHRISASDLTFLNETVDDEATIEAVINGIAENTKEKLLEEIVEEICQQADIDDQMMVEVKDIVSTVNDSLSASTAPHLQAKKGILFKICKAVEKTKNYKPRVTQMVSWCILVLSKSSRLVQVLTGEGKSCIVAMFAAYQVMIEKKNPDIISSSPVLAERDAEEWSPFYKELDITVDVNTNKSKDEDLKKCYECQVVYGTTQDFAGDFLRQRFHRRDVRPERSFQCVIVDEVDSLMLDKGLEVVYLNKHNFNLYQQCLDGSLHKLNAISRQSTNERQEISLLLLESGQCRIVYFKEDPLVISIEKSIKRRYESKEEQIESFIPGHHGLINGKIQIWIKNALLAKKMTLGHEFILHKDGVVPVDYKCTGVVQNDMTWGEGLQQFLEMKHQTKLSNMSLITNFMSNVGLFKNYSNQIYGITGTVGDQTELDMLRKLYNGIKTCKIPSFRRRKLYELEGMVIPEEDEWIRNVCIVAQNQVTPTVYRGPRAALIICETINHAEMFHQTLANTISKHKLKLYVNNNMDNSIITNSTIQEGDVIIATNLAGRGTDLKVCESVNKAGGLFVLQTFLPLNVRVEQQAFGRTARQGSPGSAQLIMCAKHFSDSVKLVMDLNTSVTSLLGRLNCLTSILLSCDSTDNLFEDTLNYYLDNRSLHYNGAMVSALTELLTMKSLSSQNWNLKMAKDARNTLVKIRLSSFLEKDIPKNTKEEELFSVYLDFLDKVYDDDVFSDQRDVIVSSLHECWGLWLMMNFSDEKPIGTLKEQLKVDLSNAKKTLLSKQSPSSMVYFCIRSGNNLREKGCLSESIEMYTKALEKDASGEIIPFYNRALATIKKKDTGYIAKALTDLKRADNAIDSYKLHLATVWTHVKSSMQEPKMEGDALLTKQFRMKCMIVDLLKMNIQDCVMKLKSAESRRGEVRLSEKHTIFLSEDFMQWAIRRTGISLAEIIALSLINAFKTRAEIKQEDLNLTENFAKFWAEHFVQRAENRERDVDQPERDSGRRSSSFLPDNFQAEDLIQSSVRVLIELLMEFEHIMFLGLDTIFCLEVILPHSGFFSKLFNLF